jgi:hypothetical protein
MANTTNYSFVLPTVGGSEDQWGANLNANWTSIDTLLGGASATEFAILDGATVSTAELNKLDGVTATTSEINILSGVTATTTEINYCDGVTSAIQTQIDAKAPIASPTFTGAVGLGGWTIAQSGSDLVFSHNGTARLKLTSTGALTAEGDVTAFGDA